MIPMTYYFESKNNTDSTGIVDASNKWFEKHPTAKTAAKGTAAVVTVVAPGGVVAGPAILVMADKKAAKKMVKKEKTAASQEHGSLNKKQKGGDVRSTTEAEKTVHTGMPPRANVVPYMDAMVEKNNQKAEKKPPKPEAKPTTYDDMLFDDIAKIYRRQPGDGNG
jgi:hypothetical protein